MSQRGRGPIAVHQKLGRWLGKYHSGLARIRLCLPLDSTRSLQRIFWGSLCLKGRPPTSVCTNVRILGSALSRGAILTYVRNTNFSMAYFSGGGSLAPVFGVEPHVLAKNTPFLNAKTAKLSSDNLAVLLAMWRRGRDLNSRYRFKPVYSLSRRAPSAGSDTSPYAQMCCAKPNAYIAELC